MPFTGATQCYRDTGHTVVRPCLRQSGNCRSRAVLPRPPASFSRTCIAMFACSAPLRGTHCACWHAPALCLSDCSHPVWLSTRPCNSPWSQHINCGCSEVPVNQLSSQVSSYMLLCRAQVVLAAAQSPLLGDKSQAAQLIPRLCSVILNAPSHCRHVSHTSCMPTRQRAALVCKRFHSPCTASAQNGNQLLCHHEVYERIMHCSCMGQLPAPVSLREGLQARTSQAVSLALTLAAPCRPWSSGGQSTQASC